MSTIRRRLVMANNSPYSAEATVALKSTFSGAQWQTIKQYGIDHPALVQFINEEPMVVISLIDGLGTRWQIGNNASIRTSIVPKDGLVIESVIKRKQDATGVVFYGTRANGAHRDWLWFELDNNASFNVNFVNQAVQFAEIKDTKTIVSHAFNGHTIINGVDVGSQPHGTPAPSAPQVGISIFGTYSSISNSTLFAGEGVTIAEINARLNGVSICKLIPYNSLGMLDIHDLEHPTLLPKEETGTFTTEEELA